MRSPCQNTVDRGGNNTWLAHNRAKVLERALKLGGGRWKVVKTMARCVTRGRKIVVNLVAFEQAFRSKISLGRKRVERVEWKASNEVFEATNCKLKLSSYFPYSIRSGIEVDFALCFVASSPENHFSFFFFCFPSLPFFESTKMEKPVEDRRADSPISERLNA